MNKNHCYSCKSDDKKYLFPCEYCKNIYCMLCLDEYYDGRNIIDICKYCLMIIDIKTNRDSDTVSI